jgi:hypothetical protein
MVLANIHLSQNAQPAHESLKLDIACLLFLQDHSLQAAFSTQLRRALPDKEIDDAL